LGRVANHKIIVKDEDEILPAESTKLVQVQIEENTVEVLMVNAGTEEINLTNGDSVGRIKVHEELTEENIVCLSEITVEMVNHGPEMTPKEVCELIILINQYRTYFVFSLSELGCTDKIQMDIVNNDEPVFSKPYRTSNDERKKIDRIVQEWKEAGLVTEIKSAYASPVLLVSNKNGDARLVVDYHKLNAQNFRKVFPTPTIDEHLGSLYGSKLFTTLDLASGYLQVPLTDRSKEKTTFITPSETGQLERMVFGLVNAPYEFSRLMQRIMYPLRNKVAMWYLDDVIIPATFFGDMLSRLQKVLEVLQEAKLTLKMSKCHFGYEQVTYLGFILSEDGIRPGTQTVTAKQQMNTPKDWHEVRRLLDLIGFFRRFIPYYSQVAAPKSELLKNGKVFIWGPEQEEAYQTLKNKLTEGPMLHLFNPNKTTELHCDASSLGIRNNITTVWNRRSTTFNPCGFQEGDGHRKELSFE